MFTHRAFYLSAVIIVPTRNLKLNKYGNLIGGRNKITRLLKKKSVFQGTINGVAVIWSALCKLSATVGVMAPLGHQVLELLVTCENAVIYQPSFDFYGIIEHSLLKNISIEMDKAIN